MNLILPPRYHHRRNVSGPWLRLGQDFAGFAASAGLSAPKLNLSELTNPVTGHERMALYQGTPPEGAARNPNLVDGEPTYLITELRDGPPTSAGLPGSGLYEFDTWSGDYSNYGHDGDGTRLRAELSFSPDRLVGADASDTWWVYEFEFYLDALWPGVYLSEKSNPSGAPKTQGQIAIAQMPFAQDSGAWVDPYSIYVTGGAGSTQLRLQPSALQPSSGSVDKGPSGSFNVGPLSGFLGRWVKFRMAVQWKASGAGAKVWFDYSGDPTSSNTTSEYSGLATLPAGTDALYAKLGIYGTGFASSVYDASDFYSAGVRRTRVMHTGFRVGHMAGSTDGVDGTFVLGPPI